MIVYDCEAHSPRILCYRKQEKMKTEQNRFDKLQIKLLYNRINV